MAKRKMTHKGRIPNRFDAAGEASLANADSAFQKTNGAANELPPIFKNRPTIA